MVTMNVLTTIVAYIKWKSIRTNVNVGSLSYMKDKNNLNGGVSFIGLLQLAFIVLKLCGIIKWSWLWVLCPMWLGAVILLIVFVVMLIIATRG